MGEGKRVAWAVALLAGGSLLLGSAAGGLVTVRAMNARVLAKPRFIAPAVAAVERGEHLTSLGRQGAWRQVRTRAGAEGWIAEQFLTDKKVELSSRPGGDAARVSQEEVEQAGRAFTAEAEREYRKGNPVHFDDVDRIEKLVVEPVKLVGFAEAGKLAGGAP